MTKTFDHAVIYNGVLYSANTPIEFAKPKEAVSEDTESVKVTAKDKDSEKGEKDKDPEKEVTVSDKRTGRKSGTGDKDNK